MNLFTRNYKSYTFCAGLLVLFFTGNTGLDVATGLLDLHPISHASPVILWMIIGPLGRPPRLDKRAPSQAARDDHLKVKWKSG